MGCTARCECGVEFAFEGQPADEPRCPSCGAIARAFVLRFESGSIQALDGIRIKGKNPGSRKPFLDSRSGPDWSVSRQKFVHLERVIDRANDDYSELVRDLDTDEIIHHCREPLSAHRK